MLSMLFHSRDGMDASSSSSSSVAPNNTMLQSESERIGAIYLKMKTKEDPNSESMKKVKTIYDALKAVVKKGTDDKNGELIAKSKLITS